MIFAYCCATSADDAKAKYELGYTGTESSREMHEIIFDGCTFNPGLNYLGNVTGHGALVYTVDRMLIETG